MLPELLRQPLAELRHRPRGQVPPLDALRSLAVMLVVFMHVSAVYFTRLTEAGVVPAHTFFISTGWFGVDLFFVLSGYLIGKQLWREMARTRDIDVRRFLLRRGLRIWPLYFSVFLCVGLLLGRAHWPPGKGWSDLLFLTNYINRGVVMGSWSLCTEEQFYVLAPTLLLWGLARGRSPERMRRALWALFLLLPLLRSLVWYRLTGDLRVHDAQIFNRFLWKPLHTHADGLILGMIIAHVEVFDARRYQRGFFSSGACVLAAVALWIVLRFLHREVLALTGITLLFGAVVWYLLSRPRPWLRIFDSEAFYVLSRLSFGMYLNHEYIHEPLVGLTFRLFPGAITHPLWYSVGAASLVFLLSAALSLVTFCVVESPFLQMRERLRGHGSRNEAPGAGSRSASS